MRATRRLIACVLALATSVAGEASWLSDITGVNIDVPRGTISFSTPRPQDIPQALANLPQDVGQLFLAPHGAALAAAIRQAAGQAGGESQPIPESVRETLAPFFPPYILNKARWTLYNPARFSIDSAILGWFNGEGAVTLDNIVVFSNQQGALDYRLWAHELVHVSQYDQMGVESFATVYSINWESLENQAREWEQKVGWTVANQQGQYQQQTFYSWNRPSSPQQIPANAWQQAAQVAFPPGSCAQTQMTAQALWVTNVCPVSIRVTGWQQQNPWNGFVVPIACTVNCVVGPGQNLPFWSQAPGPMVSVGYVY